MAVDENLEETPTFAHVTHALYEQLEAFHQQENLPSNKQVSWKYTTYYLTCVVVMTTVLLALRFILTKRVFKPIASYYDIPAETRKKVPESGWGFIFYTCASSYTFYVVVLSGKYQFFQKPETMWKGWSLEAFPPGDIYFIHVISTAHYLQHSYAMMFLDTKRKDFVIMVVHHVSSIISMFISHANRCHNLAVFTIFLLNMSMGILEFTKLCDYFRLQGLKGQLWIGVMRNIGVCCLAVIWVASRLYWYPLKVMYEVFHPRTLNLNIPYFFSLQLLAWIYLVLTLYWSKFILKTVYNFTIRQTAGDAREYVDTEKCSEPLSFDVNCSESISKEKHLGNFRQVENDKNILNERQSSCIFSPHDFNKEIITEKKSV